jgi:hypothetical protein
MNASLVAFAKELAGTQPNDLPEKFLQLERRSRKSLDESIR